MESGPANPLLPRGARYVALAEAGGIRRQAMTSRSGSAASGGVDLRAPSSLTPAGSVREFPRATALVALLSIIHW